MKKNLKKCVSIVLGLLLLLVLSLLSACQTDIQGPAINMKVMRKGENNNQEWKSRSVGMKSTTGYSWSVGNYGKTK